MKLRKVGVSDATTGSEVSSGPNGVYLNESELVLRGIAVTV